MRISQDLARFNLTTALGVRRTPEDVRAWLHHPWMVELFILAIVGLVVLASLSYVALIMQFN
jgi:hypothetical protein